jgi:hypothetical protein
MATVVVLMMLCMRVIRGWRILDRPVGAGVTRLIVLFSLLIGPVYFVHSLFAGTYPILDRLHGHQALALMMTVAALVLLRLSSLLIAHFPRKLPSLISVCEFLLVASILLQAAVIQRNFYPDNYSFMDDIAEPFRKPIEQQLSAIPGQHLVLVRYEKDHNSGEEYVYNDADIDHAKIVWARETPGIDLGPLFSYFRNRDVWVYDPDLDDESVSRYLPQGANQ